MPRQRKPRMAWGSDGRPVEITGLMSLASTRHERVWTIERRERARQHAIEDGRGRKGKAAQLANYRARTR